RAGRARVAAGRPGSDRRRRGHCTDRSRLISRATPVQYSAPMTQRSSLGPRLQRHRTAVSALGVIGWLVTGPLIVLISLVVVGASRLPELLLIALVGVVITAVM